MRATALAFFAFAIAAPIPTAIDLAGQEKPDHAINTAQVGRARAKQDRIDAAVVANPEETANGVGWKRFVHTFSGNGTRTDAHATVVTTAPALAFWMLTVGCLACAGTLMRRRSWFRN